MIQLKRGSTLNWIKQKEPLAEGQPGYDKDTNQIKIGDGKRSWLELPKAGGLSFSDVLSSEKEAKETKAALMLLSPLAALLDNPVFTYGEENPAFDTLGKVYLQCYASEPEVDYVVETGLERGWFYQKRKSGRAHCCTTFMLSTAVDTPIGTSSIYSNSTDMQSIEYPFTFKEAPSELASLQSPGGLVWLAASKGVNTKDKSAIYNILSVDKQTTPAYYKITLKVDGFIK